MEGAPVAALARRHAGDLCRQPDGGRRRQDTDRSSPLPGALTARRRTPFFLTRGYGGQARGPVLVAPENDGADGVGDEAVLLARAAPTIVARDRAKGAALAHVKGADMLVMDDGHQNFSLCRKILSLIAVDGMSRVRRRA